MSDLLLEPDDASTPLTVEEREGLIPSYITLRREMNEQSKPTSSKPNNGHLGARAACSMSAS